MPKMDESNPFPHASGVYTITNRPTGRVYVGGTTDLRSRRNAHLRDLRHGKHPSLLMQTNWDAHGADAFEFDIVELMPPGSLLATEQRWLDATRASDPAFGYNTHPNAASGKDAPVRPETREKLRQANLGKTHTLEVRRKIGEKARGRKYPGRVRSPDVRAKISASMRGRVLSEETRERIAAARRGMTQSPATLAKISAARKGVPWSASARAAHEQANVARRLAG